MSSSLSFQEIVKIMEENGVFLEPNEKYLFRRDPIGVYHTLFCSIRMGFFSNLSSCEKFFTINKIVKKRNCSCISEMSQQSVYTEIAVARILLQAKDALCHLEELSENLQRSLLAPESSFFKNSSKTQAVEFACSVAKVEKSGNFSNLLASFEKNRNPTDSVSDFFSSLKVEERTGEVLQKCNDLLKREDFQDLLLSNLETSSQKLEDVPEGLLYVQNSEILSEVSLATALLKTFGFEANQPGVFLKGKAAHYTYTALYNYENSSLQRSFFAAYSPFKASDEEVLETALVLFKERESPFSRGQLFEALDLARAVFK